LLVGRRGVELVFIAKPGQRTWVQVVGNTGIATRQSNHAEFIMATQLRCQCGQQLQVPDDQPGKKFRCPKCRNTV